MVQFAMLSTPLFSLRVAESASQPLPWLPLLPASSAGGPAALRLQVSLLSFPVVFQRKRYKGSVGAGAVRDFRGAMSGRGDKGLLITTGTFTPDAKREARRAGAPPVNLIDGDRLCELLKEYTLGVQAVEAVSIDATWLNEV
jgi:hypothetical protein